MFEKITDKVTELAVAAKVYDARSVMKDFASRFHRDESGAAMVEYTVLLGLILAITIATISLVGTNLSTIWNSVQTATATAAGN